jgi:hypothetical protein
MLTPMAARDRFIIWGWIAVVVAAGIFPPWDQRGYPEGYHLIFSPPRNRGAIHVDQSRLMIEWIIVTAIVAGLRFAWPVGKPEDIRPGDVFEEEGKAYIVRRIEKDLVYFDEVGSAEESEYNIEIPTFRQYYARPKSKISKKQPRAQN